MVLLERTAQRNRLHALWEAARGGSGGVVHIHGPAGSGKSALLHEFCTTVRADGAIVLTAACARAEREDPLATVRQLLETAQTGAAASGALRSAVAALESDALVAEITALARDRPVLIAVDDVRNADSRSVRHLLALACRAPWARILIVLTERTSAGSERSALHDELLGTAAARTVGVATLSVGGVRNLLAEYGAAADDPRAEHLWWLTGGNPLLAHALAPELLRRNCSPSTGVCPPDCRPSPNFRTVVRNLIRSLDQPEIQVLRAVAVVSSTADIGELQGVLGTPPPRLAHVLEELERVGLLVAGRFSHPTVLDEVLADMTDDEQMRWHVRAAEYLMRQRAPATAVAAHLVEAGRVPHARMVDVLQEAAAALLVAQDAHEAKRCLDLARRSSLDACQVAEIEFALVRVEHQIAPSSAARRLPSVASAITDDRLRSEGTAELLEMVCWYSGPDASGEMLARIASASAAGGRTAAELESSRMLVTTVFPGLAATPSSSTADGGPEPRPFRYARMDLLRFAWSVLHEGWSAQAAQQADRLLTSVDLRARDSRAVFVALTVMAVAGQPVSPSVCDRLIDGADSRGAVVAKAMFLAARADANLIRGHVAAAERDARMALDGMPAEAWGVGIGQPVATLLQATTESGRAFAAAEPLGVPVPDAMYESVFGLPYLHARGVHLLGLRQPRAALEAFRSCGLLIARWGLGHDVAVLWRYGAARALVALGDKRGAREILNDQLAGLAGGINRGLALRLMASLSSQDTALRLLAEAQALFDHAGNGLESARTLATMSKLHDRQGERARARVERARARQLAQDIGVPRLLDEFAPSSTSAAEPQRPALVVAPHDGTTVLTDAESRVVKLVVRGHTNREISDQLFVTVSTVEQHLTSVFRKLKVKRRRELVALLAGRAEREVVTPV